MTDSTTKDILSLAKQNNIQIVGISETMPDNKNVIEWLTSELDEIENAMKDK